MLKTISTILLFVLLCIPSAYAQKKNKKKKNKTTPVVTISPEEAEYKALSEFPLVKAIFLDSVVCSEADIAENIPIPRHAGILRKYQDGGISLENDFGDMRLLTAKNHEGNLRIYRQEKLNQEWSTPTEVTIDAEFTDIRSPFLLSDGQTLYFSARNINNEEHTYNIYTSTLDTETGTFKKPMQLPLPYRSEADDLYFFADEADSLAWFVTTRNQPEGMVCIYTVRTTQPWEYYDSESLSQSQFLELAKLANISATWPSVEERNTDIQRMHETLKSYSDVSEAENTNGLSATEKALKKRYSELSIQYEDLSRKLREYRLLYHNSKSTARKDLVSIILSLEQNLEATQSQLQAISHEIKK